MTACLRFAPAAALALTLAALGRPAAADPEIVCGPYLRDWSAAVQAKDAGHLHALNAQIAVIAGQCPDLARRARTYVIPRSPNAPPVAQVTRAQPTLTRVKAKAEAPRTRANQLARWGLTDAKWRLTSGDQLVKLVDVGAKQSELRTAANGGDQIAMTLLGFYYYLRQPLGAGDPKASYIWIKKAADRGEPPAIRTLSFFYLFDLGVVSPRDPADGRNLLVRAAKGH